MTAKDILEKIKTNWQFVLICVSIILFMLLLNQCSTTRKLKAEIARQELISGQNLAALNDTIKVYKNRIGEMSYVKPIAMMSIDELEKYYPELYAALKAEWGEVKVIWKTRIIYRDTGSVKNSVLNLEGNKYALDFDYTSLDRNLRIKARNTFFATPILIDEEKNIYDIETKPGITTIQDFSLKLGFTTGVKKDNDGIYRIFVTPDSDKIVVTDLKGADISELFVPPPAPKKKRWGIGPYIGVGLSTDMKLSPQVGLGVTYSIIRF